MAKNKSITLCADDYALSHGVSAGILEALRAGRLSAVSVLTNGPRWPALGRDLARAEFDADIGLHFNLTLGAPLGTMPRFAPKGAFPPVSHVVRMAMRNKLPMDEIREEIDRQLDRFQAVMLRLPDFVDGHQHVQALPGIRGALLDALEHRIFLRGAQVKKALVVRGLAAGFRRAARRAGFVVNDGFAGFSEFNPGHDYAAQFESYLRARGRRHLIMCHPGHVDQDLRALDPVTVTREQELAFLLSPRFAEMLERRGLKLARLGR
jgi:hypothetical protein